MSKLAATGEVPTVRSLAPQGGGAFGLVPIVTVVANVTDVNGAVLDLTRRIQALLGEQDAVDMDGAVLDLTRRIQALVGEPRTLPRSTMEAGELRIDVDAHRVTVSGEEVLLTALEFKLLVMLASRRERVQSRGTLLSDVWSCSPQSKTRTVDTHVKRLREKLRSAGRFIRTIRGTGYLFTEVPSRARHGSREGSARSSGSAMTALRAAAGAGG